MSLYRYYLGLNERGIRGKGPGDGKRLTVPTLLLFGENDLGISPRLVRDGWQDHADDMTLELTGAGHFIVNEKPELVVARARTFLA